MVRPVTALKCLLLLKREGKVGCRWGRDAAEPETMDYQEFIARVVLPTPDTGRSRSTIKVRFCMPRPAAWT